MPLPLLFFATLLSAFVTTLDSKFSSMRSLLLCLFGLTSAFVFAQTPSLMSSGITIGSPNGTVKIFDPITESQRKSNEVETYADVRGEYFWDSEWSPALVVLRDGRQARLAKAKLNQYTGEIHFVYGGHTEFIARKGMIKQFAFLDRNDSTRVSALFEVLIFDSKSIDSYCQVLNSGQKQLLKQTTVSITKDDMSVLAKPEAHFVRKDHYYLKEGNQVNKLKNLNKSSVFAAITPSAGMDDWLNTHKNKLRNEGEIVAFLNYLNTVK